jgi:hypothetical protein
LKTTRESRVVAFGGVSHPVLRVKQGLLAAGIAETILSERAKTNGSREAKPAEQDRHASARAVEKTVPAGVREATRGEGPKGFRDLTWGDPPSSDMSPNAVTPYEAALGIVEYTRPTERLQVGDVSVTSIKYDFRDGRLVAVSISVLGEKAAFREIIESQFGPFELVHEARNKPGWPFIPRTGVPLEGFEKKYMSGLDGVVCLVNVDNGIGTTLHVRMMASEEASRRDEIRRQILEKGGRDF